MTDRDTEQDDLIRRLATQYQIPERIALPTSPTAEELLKMIMNTDTDPVASTVASGRSAPWWSHRRLVIGASMATGLAAVALVLGVVLPPAGPGGPAPAAALEIVPEDGYLVISITDPVADADRYRAEIAEHGLDIDLQLAPAAPEQVGRVIFMEVGDTGDGPTLEVTEAPGECAASGSCAVELRVPPDFSVYAQVVLGRTPLPDESFENFTEGDSPVLTPEEQGQLAALVGLRVSEAEAALAGQGWSAEYRIGIESIGATAEEVPDDWYVYDAAPLGGGVVALFVDEDPTP